MALCVSIVCFFFADLSVECVGKSQVQWSESESRGRETETVLHHASENYYNERVVLRGSGNLLILLTGNLTKNSIRARIVQLCMQIDIPS